MNEHTVGDVARISHVSVRTLHHYDRIGLLPPSGRSDAGYRLYSDADLQRLGRILFFRELELPLVAIARILDDPGTGADDHLRRQHRLLRERRDRAQELIEAVETEMEARRMGMSLTPEEQFEVFGAERADEHAAEAQERWGQTDAWRTSRRRVAAYGKDDWLRMKAEADATIAAFAALAAGGEPAAGPAAMDVAEAHRAHIARWFYDCDPAMHRRLAGLYVADARFAATYERVAPGLARYVHDAIVANAGRHDG